MGNFGQNDVAKVLAKHFSFQPLDFCFRKPLKSLTAYLRQFASRKNLKFCEVAYVGFPSLSAVQAVCAKRTEAPRVPRSGYPTARSKARAPIGAYCAAVFEPPSGSSLWSSSTQYVAPEGRSALSRVSLPSATHDQRWP